MPPSVPPLDLSRNRKSPKNEPLKIPLFSEFALDLAAPKLLVMQVVYNVIPSRRTLSCGPFARICPRGDRRSLLRSAAQEKAPSGPDPAGYGAPIGAIRRAHPRPLGRRVAQPMTAD